MATIRSSLRVLAPVLLLLASAAGARGQTLADYDYTNLAFRGAGVTVGYIWPTKVSPTTQYGLRVDLGYLGPAIRIVPSLSYWHSELRRGELNRFASRINALPALQQQGVTITGADLGPVHWSDLSLDVDAEWVVAAPSGLLTYAGLGAGVHLLNGSGAAIAHTFIEDLLDTISPALTGLAGVEYPVANQVRVFGELRLTALGDIQYAGLRFGGAIMMPGHSGGSR
jgi:hypothetical protein